MWGSVFFCLYCTQRPMNLCCPLLDGRQHAGRPPADDCYKSWSNWEKLPLLWLVLLLQTPCVDRATAFIITSLPSFSHVLLWPKEDDCCFGAHCQQQSIICVSWFVPLFPLQSCLVITRTTFGRWHSLLLVTTSTYESRGNGLEIMSASETDIRYFLHRCPSPSFSFTVIDKMIESGDSGAVTAGRFQTNFYHAKNSPQRRLL